MSESAEYHMARIAMKEAIAKAAAKVTLALRQTAQNIDGLGVEHGDLVGQIIANLVVDHFNHIDETSTYVDLVNKELIGSGYRLVSTTAS
jgi:hypothetical protein